MQDNTPKLPKNAAKEIGQSGTILQGGTISGEEYNRKLTGLSALSIYEEMRRSDSNVHSALQLVKLPLQGATWGIQPAVDPDGNITPEDQEIADFIKHELMDHKVNWKAFLRQTMTFLDFGYSVFEKVYSLTEFNGKPRIGIEKLAPRKQTTIYLWETEDQKPGITQRLVNGSGVVSIPREKLIHFANERDGDNYEGISLLRFCYKDWHIKSKLTLVNAIGLEKQAVGVPVLRDKPGENPSAADIAAAEQAAQNMRANEKAYIRLPSSIDLEMLDMKASTTKDVIPTLNYHKRAIYESILATFMDLGGSSGSGANSLSSDLTSFFMKAEEATANIIIEAIAEDLIRQICDLNFSDMPNGYPKLTCTNISDDDVSALATSASTLATAGLLTPDSDLEDDLRKRFKFPLLPEALKTDPDDEDDAGSDDKKDNPDEIDVTKDDEDELTKDQKKDAAIKAAIKARNNLLELEFQEG